MPVIDFHKPTFAGMIFEVALGQGKLLVCGVDLSSPRPEARQLRHSLVEYAASEQFNPQENVSEHWLNARLRHGQSNSKMPRFIWSVPRSVRMRHVMNLGANGWIGQNFSPGVMNSPAKTCALGPMQKESIGWQTP